MLFKELIAAYTKYHTKLITTKCSITDCQTDGTYSYLSTLKG
jgi:hypothetical protein